MSNITETEDRIMEFLRCNVSEPLRSGGSARQTSTSQTFTATPSQTVFTITDNPTKNLMCFPSVLQNSTTLSKYSQYNIDLVNKKVTLLTAAASNDTIKINYDYGDRTWIYADKPREDLTSVSYPRIGVIKISTSGEHLGTSSNTLWEEHRFQIDVLVPADTGLVYSGETKYGSGALKALKRRLETALEVTYPDALNNTLFYIRPIAKNPTPFDEPNSRYRYIMEYLFRYYNDH